MGCDIHMYVEYKRKGDERDYWQYYGQRINPGRNYYIFGLISKGVRSDNDLGLEPKGIPENLSFYSYNDYWISINDKYAGDEGFCSTEQAEKWAEYGSIIDKERNLVSNPDWHSHSWLTTKELEEQLEIYKEESDWVNAEYFALLSSMKELEKHDLEARVVFWFDN